MTDKRKLSLYAIASISYYLLCIYVLEDKLPCLYRTSYALLLGLLWKYYEPRIVRFLNTKYMIIFFGHVLHSEKPGFDRRRKEDHVRPKTIKRV